MKLVKYHVQDVRQGLEQIKEELGNQAVIVETTRITSGRQAGLLEIVVGVEDTPAAAPSLAPLAPPAPPAPAAPTTPREERPEIAAMMGLVDDLRRQILSLQTEVRSLRSRPAPAPTRDRRPASLPADLRRQLQTELHRHDARGGESAARTISFFYQLLTNQGLLADHIEEILAFALGADAAWSQSPRKAQELLGAELTRRLHTTDPLWITASDRPEVAVLVGPTGVGKTTTVAKIAAHARVAGRKKVAVICADPCRVGGAYQIRTYADLMQIPSRDVSTAEELRAALRAFSDKELILVDTTGQTPWAPPSTGLPLDRLPSLTPESMDLQFHLCLSASTRTADLLSISDHMRHLPLRSLIFTKIDEATALGGLVSTVMHTGLPLSILGQGPNVPGDVLVPTAREIASWVQFERSPS